MVHNWKDLVQILTWILHVLPPELHRTTGRHVVLRVFQVFVFPQPSLPAVCLRAPTSAILTSFAIFFVASPSPLIVLLSCSFSTSMTFL